jgi:hypothetical protein
VAPKGGHGGNGCACFGLGSGQPDPKAFNEPTAAPSLVFRMAPNDFVGAGLTAAVGGQQVEESRLGDGTHRLRLSWNAAKKCAWLEIHKDWKPGVPFTPTVSLLVPGVAAAFGNDTRLLAGGAGGVPFADYSAKRVTAEELAKLPMTGAFPNDPSAKSRLPVKDASALARGDTAVAPVDALLKNLDANLRPVVCWYKGAALTASRPLPGGNLTLPNSKWHSSIVAKPVAGEHDALDLTVSISLLDGGASSSGIAAAFDFANWNAANYVLIPASVYQPLFPRHAVRPPALASAFTRKAIS